MGRRKGALIRLWFRVGEPAARIDLRTLPRGRRHRRASFLSRRPLKIDPHAEAAALPDHHVEVVVERAFQGIEPEQDGLGPPPEHAPQSHQVFAPERGVGYPGHQPKDETQGLAEEHRIGREPPEWMAPEIALAPLLEP